MNKLKTGKAMLNSPEKILKNVRNYIREYAGEDPAKWFLANRFIYARLQLDERKTKEPIKKALFAANVPCHYCKEEFENKKGVDLHRINGDLGYSNENCVLMHPECHKKHHKENPLLKRNRSKSQNTTLKGDSKIIQKSSKKYTDGSFSYWWDFSPSFIEKSKHYEEVQFVQKDTNFTYTISVESLAMFFREDRRTSRGKGNWGVKILHERPNELAFEPANSKGGWLFLNVNWNEQDS